MQPSLEHFKVHGYSVVPYDVEPAHLDLVEALSEISHSLLAFKEEWMHIDSKTRLYRPLSKVDGVDLAS